MAIINDLKKHTFHLSPGNILQVMAASVIRMDTIVSQAE
jgi:hypothetical protein